MQISATMPRHAVPVKATQADDGQEEDEDKLTVRLLSVI